MLGRLNVEFGGEFIGMNDWCALDSGPSVGLKGRDLEEEGDESIKNTL